MPFSNGTEFMIFQDNFCCNCQHYVEDKNTNTAGCPITDMLAISESDDQEKISDIFLQQKEGSVVGCKCFRELGE